MKKFDNKLGKAYIENQLLSKQTNPICPLIGCIGGSNSGLAPNTNSWKCAST